MSKKTILFKSTNSDELFIKVIYNDGFNLTYQIHPDSVEDFREWAETTPNRKFVYSIMDLEDGLYIDNDLVEIKEVSIPYKTVLNEFKDKVIIPEVMDMAFFKDKKQTWDDILKNIQEKSDYVLQIDLELLSMLKKYYNPPTLK